MTSPAWAWELSPLAVAQVAADGTVLRLNRAGLAAVAVAGLDAARWAELVAGDDWELAAELPQANGSHEQVAIRTTAAGLLAETVHQAPVTLTVKRPDGVYLAANALAADVLATTVQGVTGTRLEDHGVAYLDAALAAERLVLESGQPVTLEIEQRTPDGLRTLLMLKFPVHTADGTLVGGLSFDISERKAAETELARSRDAARNSIRAKDEFMSRMSHELRTPLNAILGFGQLLQLTSLPAGEDRQSADQVVRAGRQLLRLVDQLLDLSTMSTDELHVSLEPVALTDVVRAALATVAPLAVTHGATLVAPAPEALDGAVVTADQQRLQQVLVNLLDNAIRYHPFGTVTLSVEPLGERWLLHVQDQGEGIPEQARVNLFSAFERHHPGAGNGLGLALSAGMMKAMHGTLVHSDASPAGTRFTLALPTTELTAREEVPDPELVPVLGQAQQTVIYIEDNVSNVHLMSRILERWPHITLIPAIQGSIGIDLVLQHRPAVVLLDLNLPDMHGADVLAQLKASPLVAHVPVVVISADATANQRRRLLDQGAFAYVTKPFVIADLLKVLGEAFGPPGG